MARDIQIAMHVDGTDAQKALTRARRAMDAALIRAHLAHTLGMAALVRAGRGVAHDPACAARPARVHWSRHALKGIGREPKPLRLGDSEYAWQPEAGD